MITTPKIAGAELWYERGADPVGIGFQFDPTFFRTFEECFIEIGELYKVPRRIILAGTFVDKPGAHKLARAADLDGIEFEDGSEWSAAERTRLTAALQAVFMKRFGVVLGWTYDEAHGDHFHVDDTKEWGFRYNSRSIVSFIQWALGFEGHELEVDGIWGPKTLDAFFGYDVLHKKLVCPTNTEYRDFLTSISEKFFNRTRREYYLDKLVTHEIITVVDPRIEALEKIRDIAAFALQEGDSGSKWDV